MRVPAMRSASARATTAGASMFSTSVIDSGTGWWYTDENHHGTHVAGTISALNDDDYIASTHRGHGHLIAKGGDLNAMHEAEKVLTDLVRNHPGEVTLLALGPLTNVAAALRRDVEWASLVGQVVFVGGALGPKDKNGPAPDSWYARIAAQFQPEEWFEDPIWGARVEHGEAPVQGARRRGQASMRATSRPASS